MFKHLLITSLRSFKRHRSSFIINVLGLSMGLACVLFILLWIQDERSYDQFHKNGDRLFQVMKNSTTPKGEVNTFEWTPGPLAASLIDDFPEIEYAVGVEYNDGQKGILTFEDKKVKASEYYAGKDFFNVFSFELLFGDKGQVLTQANQLLISDQLANKLFSSPEAAVGQSVEWEQETMAGPYEVAGVFKTPPVNSTLQFDLLLSYDQYLRANPEINQWTYGGPSTFVSLKEGTDPSLFDQKIASYLQEKSQEDYQQLFIRPFTSRYLYAKYENGEQAGGRIAYVRLFGIIALFILLIACINFMNLATARATGRMKEVGVKKAIGAGRGRLVVQYLSESLLTTLIGLLLALVFVNTLLPSFSLLTGKELTLNFNWPLLYSIIGITAFTGLVAGSYPAFYLSSFKPAQVLKGKLGKMLGAMWARKGLVVFQFTISLILIIAVFVTYQQVDFLQNKNLGFNKDQVISIIKEGEINQNPAPFLDAVRNIPNVKHASTMRNNLVENHSSTIGVRWEGLDPDNRVAFSYLSVDYDFVETMELELLEGRAFSPEYRQDTLSIIFNEAAIKAMGMDDPVGKMVRQWGENKQIIGVVKDFHFQSLYEEVKPCFLFLEPDSEKDNILVKIEAGQEMTTIGEIEKLYKSFNTGLAFEYHFLDADFQRVYESEIKVSLLSRYFAGIAILLSCLGLFGLVAFTADRRKKEISIRKVLGASVTHIIRLLSLQFLKLVLVSIVVALPIAWLIAQRWLESFAYRVELSFGLLFGAAVIAILIAMLTTCLQGLRAALNNPMDSLRGE